MNSRALLISLIMSAIAVFFVQSYVQSVEEESSKRYGTQLLVMVAKKDIKEMDTITETSLAYKEVPKKFLEPAAVSVDPREKDEQAKAKDLLKYAGSIAIVPIKKGEQVTLNKITEPSVRTGLSPQISQARRGVTVRVNDSTGVAKLVKPGDRVDIVVVVDPQSGLENKFARTLFQDVAVLAVGKNVTNNPARTVEVDPLTGKERVKALSDDVSFSTVTLEVDANQAQTLAFLDANPRDATLVLTLRHNDDSERVNLPTVSFRDLVAPSLMNGRMPAGR